ncbi:MAG: hypothetical protein SGJ02_05735 [bacterium]|nr:hypothetical protein [bacterium]
MFSLINQFGNKFTCELSEVPRYLEFKATFETEKDKASYEAKSKTPQVKQEAEVEAPKAPVTEPESTDPLKLKTNKELLEILLKLDPQSTFDDRTVKADIIEAINVFQSE